MDLALSLQLLLLLVFLRQGVFHLLEPDIVHAGRVDMTADQLSLGDLRQANGHLDGSIGVVRVVEGHVDLAIHLLLSLLLRATVPDLILADCDNLRKDRRFDDSEFGA